MNEASITKAIRESLRAMEQGSEHELVAAIQFLSAVELAHELNYHVAVFRDQSNGINVLLKREHECSFVELAPHEHEVTVAIP
jgi:hypothetical protein